MFNRMRSWGAGLVALTLIVPLLAGCDTGTSGTSTKPNIIVSSKDFTEEILVGEMYAQLLEQGGYPVTRKLNLGSTAVAQPALVKGDIQVYPEYTGTGLTVVLKKDAMSDAKQVFDIVSKEYESQFKLTWLDPAPMNDTQALATTKAIADKYGLKTLSDLSGKADQLRLVALAEFLGREQDGLPALQKTYGGFKFKETITVDNALKYQTLLDGKADIAEAFSTDGAVGGNNLVVLVDDKNLFPVYQIAPVIRDDVLTANPDIKGILNALAPKLTNDAVAKINWEVDGKKREPKDVATEFLKANGLVK